MNLFFARMTTRQNDIDRFLPIEMTRPQTILECWNLLKNELLQENIDSIEEFMYYIFVDLFSALNKEKNIKYTCTATGEHHACQKLAVEA